MESNLARDGGSMFTLCVLTLYNDIYMHVCTIVLCLTFSCFRNFTRLWPCLRLGSVFTVPWWPMGGSHWDEMSDPGRVRGLPEWRSNSRVPAPAPAAQSVVSESRVMWPHQRSWATITMSALDFDDVSIRDSGNCTLLITNFGLTRKLCRKNIKFMFPTAQKRSH